jgi:predicted neutral ceramidase superfamily lipid hydrolase
MTCSLEAEKDRETIEVAVVTGIKAAAVAGETDLANAETIEVATEVTVKTMIIDFFTFLHH